MGKPDIYAQKIEDEFDENTDTFDGLMPVIGGKRDGDYRVGIRVDSGYKTKIVDSLEEGKEYVEDLLDEEDLSYEFNGDLEDYLIEVRDWIDQ